MSDKIKPRHERTPKRRNYEQIQMMRQYPHGGPMRDRRDKRGKRDREWQQEVREYTS